MTGPSEMGGLLSRAYEVGVRQGFPAVLRSGVEQFCSIVEDIESAVRQTSEILGVGPIAIGEPTPLWSYRGRPAPDIRIKAAFIPWGKIHIEYIQWLGGDSIYKEHIERKGYGLHHIGISTYDLNADLEAFQKIGVGVLQLGRNLETGGGVAYMDTEDLLGVIMELIPPVERIAALVPFKNAEL